MGNAFIGDGSGDKKYFTIIPNYIGNHSSAIDQALYFQIKKHCGENGDCFVSKRTLKKKLGVSHRTLNKSFDYLTKMGWIKKIGEKKISTESGRQVVSIYKTADIWKMNITDLHSDKDIQYTSMCINTRSQKSRIPCSDEN